MSKNTSDTPSDMTFGYKHKTNGYGVVSVVKYDGCNDVTVVFVSTGFVVNTTAYHIRTGSIKDPLMPIASGVGFIGDGIYSCSKHKSAHSAWISMLSRCYGNKSKTYANCSVCAEWHNFQNFAMWYQSNYPVDGGKYDLDKDMKYIGNKVYSPDSCLFISHKVNSFMIGCASSRGNSKIGTSIERDGKYSSYCRNPINSKKTHLGRFISQDSAHLAWRKRKSEFAKQLMDVSTHESDIIALNNYKKALDNFEIYKDGFNYV